MQLGSRFEQLLPSNLLADSASGQRGSGSSLASLDAESLQQSGPHLTVGDLSR